VRCGAVKLRRKVIWGCEGKGGIEDAGVVVVEEKGSVGGMIS